MQLWTEHKLAAALKPTVEVVSPRHIIAYVWIFLGGKKRKLRIVVAHAPIRADDCDVVDNFYHDLCSRLRPSQCITSTIILGDFNARLGSIHVPGIIGTSAAEEEDPNGTRLREMCEQFGLHVANTFIEGETKPWCCHVNGKWYRNDYVILSPDIAECTCNTRVAADVDLRLGDSYDHRCVAADITLRIQASPSRSHLITTSPSFGIDEKKIDSPECLAVCLQRAC